MIYCIGDSFTYGAELPDAMNGVKPSNFAWPAILAQKLNTPVTNLGKQATGPTRVIKRVMDCVFKGDAELLIIAWPNPDRIEWCDEEGIYDIWAGKNSKWMPHQRRAIIDKATEEWSENTDRWNYRRWLRTILLLQSFLNQHNQKYIMVQTHLSQEYNYKWHNSESELTNHIDTSYFLGWPYESMKEWTRGCPIGPWGHFLEEGHAIVADKIYEYIRHLSWVS